MALFTFVNIGVQFGGVTETDHAADNRRQQVQLYGEPLADILRSIGSTLGLSQAEIAGVLGLSAPMLSHLISARRVKIGNPIAGARLTQLRALSTEVAAGELNPEEITARLDAVGRSGAGGAEVLTTRTQPVGGSPGREIQQLFRTVAGAADWIEVANRVSTDHPEIAELLLVYGAGRADSAEEHWRRTMDPPGPSAQVTN